MVQSMCREQGSSEKARCLLPSLLSRFLRTKLIINGSFNSLLKAGGMSTSRRSTGMQRSSMMIIYTGLTMSGLSKK